MLDAGKTGHRLRPGVYGEDDAAFRKRGGYPKCMKPARGYVVSETDRFILNILNGAGKAAANDIWRRYDQPCGGPDKHKDVPLDFDLLEPYNDAQNRLDTSTLPPEIRQFAQLELRRITDHVDAAHTKWVQACKIKDKDQSSAWGSSTSAPKKGKKSRIQQEKDDLMLAAAAFFSKPVPGVVLTSNVEQIKASYAYQKNANFGFSVAFKGLCDIKAEASAGGRAPIVRLMDEVKSISSACRKLFAE